MGTISAAYSGGILTNSLDARINLLSEKNLRDVPDQNFLAICTGSQGEPLGALNRLASDNHSYLSLKKNDKIIFSSRKIPGNEVSINNLMNKLIYLTFCLIYTQFFQNQENA